MVIEIGQLQIDLIDDRLSMDTGRAAEQLRVIVHQRDQPIMDDLKVGLGHLRQWERIAVVTDSAWIANALNVFGFLKPGEVEVFPLADAGKARAWIAETTSPAS